MCFRNPRVAAKYRLCPKCKYRYEKVKKKCPSCGKARPKKRVPKHAETLRDHSYEHYVQVSKEIHSNGTGSCDACRRVPSKVRHHDRDHDHNTGNPRGLLCVRHNKMLDSRCTSIELRQLADYLDRVTTYYTKLDTKPDTKPEDNGSGGVS